MICKPPQGRENEPLHPQVTQLALDTRKELGTYMLCKLGGDLA